MKTVINLRCTVDEKDAWTARATAAGKDFSSWVRDLMNGREPVPYAPITGPWVCKCTQRNEAGVKFCKKCGRNLAWGKPAPEVGAVPEIIGGELMRKLRGQEEENG